MKKKILAAILTCAILVTPASTFADMIDVAVNPVKIFVNGSDINKENFILDGTTYVPIRAVSESLGADVQYDGINNSVYINGYTNPKCSNSTLLCISLSGYLTTNNVALLRYCYDLEDTALEIVEHYLTMPSDGHDPYLEGMPDVLKSLENNIRDMYDVPYYKSAIDLLNNNQTTNINKEDLNKLNAAYTNSKNLLTKTGDAINSLNNIFADPSIENVNNSTALFDSIEEELLDIIVQLNELTSKMAGEAMN